MTSKILQFVDIETGQVTTDGQLVWQQNRRRSPFGKDWCAVNQNALKTFIDNRARLGLDGMTALLYVMQKLDFENYIYINQTIAAKEIGMQRPHFARALKRLIDIGAVVRGPKSGQFRTLQLNPRFGWKGSTNTHSAALRGASVINFPTREIEDDRQMSLPLE